MPEHHSERKTRNDFRVTPFGMSLASDTIIMVFVEALLSSSLLQTDGDEQGGAFPFPEYGQYIRLLPVRQLRQQTAASLRPQQHTAAGYVQSNIIIWKY